jgi:protein SCO1
MTKTTVTPPNSRVVVSAVVVASVVALTSAACGGSPDTADPTADNPGGVIISEGQDSSPFKGAEPASPYQMPNITLTATNNEDFNLVTDTAYPVTLVFYGYTHCPDVCPLVLNDVASAILQLPSDVREETQFVFITTDPSRDTPDVLRTYLDHYNEEFVGLTGSLATIVRAADDMGVAIDGKHKLPSGGYDVGHGAQVIGFRGDEAPVIWTEGTPVADIVTDVTSLAGS